MATVAEELKRAAQAYQARAFDEVERICRRIVETEPAQPEALRLLGAAALGQGHGADAVGHFAAAVAAAPNDPQGHHDLGLALREQGELGAAADSFRQAVEIEPSHADARLNLIDAALRHPDRFEARWLPAFLTPPSRLSRFQIEITTWCNLKCAECPRTVSIAAGSWINKHMALDDYRRIIAHGPPAHALALQGIGEPTLHPALREMIAIARASSKFEVITFNTNAIGRSIDYYAELQAAGLSTVSVSVDSFDQDVADRCRFGTKVGKLARRVIELNRLFPAMAISIVASRLNLADIGDTLARLASLGRFLVEIQPVVNFRPTLPGEIDNSLSPADQAILNDIIETARQRHLGLQIVRASALGAGPQAGRCSRPFHAPYITIDGFLTPCCTTDDPALLGHTSLVELPIDDAWRRPAVVEWLTSYVTVEPEICIGCCFNPQREQNGRVG